MAANHRRQGGPRPEHHREPRRDAPSPQREPRSGEAGARREALRGLEAALTTHAGLWLDRFLPRQDKAASSEEAKGAIQTHIKGLGRIEVPDVYRAHVERWERHLKDLGHNARMAKATVRGRMIIGLGAESVLETAIHLHHTYGVPVMPGSALKGLTANYARNRIEGTCWHKPKEGEPIGASYRALFGDTTEAGCVIFHDALWIPSKSEGESASKKLPLDLDVMTVHHRDYYGTQGKKPPADSDDPNPVSFVTASGSYLIALEGPPEWTDAAMSLLKQALDDQGIGAKTAAGYGRLDLDYASPAEAERQKQAHVAEEARKAAELAADEARRSATRVDEDMRMLEKEALKFNGGNVGKSMSRFIEQAKRLPEDYQHRLATLCIQNLGRDFTKAHRNKAAWALELSKLRGDQP